MTRGGRICFFNSLRRNRLATCLSRRRWTKTSSTMPVWSTARHNQCFTPAILSTGWAARRTGGNRLSDQVLALATGRTQHEIASACKGARPNHVGAAISRHKRAGRIEERDGKLYASQATEAAQHAAV